MKCNTVHVMAYCTHVVKTHYLEREHWTHIHDWYFYVKFNNHHFFNLNKQKH